MLDADAIGCESGDLCVVCVGDYDGLCALRLHIGEQLQRLLVTHNRCFKRSINRGEDNERDAIADQSVGAVLEFANRVALGMNIRSFLEFERAFASDGVVDAAAELKK